MPGPRQPCNKSRRNHNQIEGVDGQKPQDFVLAPLCRIDGLQPGLDLGKRDIQPCGIDLTHQLGVSCQTLRLDQLGGVPLNPAWHHPTGPAQLGLQRATPNAKTLFHQLRKTTGALGKRFSGKHDVSPPVDSAQDTIADGHWPAPIRGAMQGRMLNTILTGDRTDRPPLLIAHGLFGSARNWGVIAKRLSDDRQVIAVDMRNHGDSVWHDGHGYTDMAQDLAEVIDAHGGRADVVGHSMGGKAAMALALRHPETVNHLVIADIAPVAYGHTQSHLIHAMRSLDPSAIEKRSEADAELLATIPEAGVRAFLLQSLDLKENRWRLNLDTLEADMPRIVGWPDLAGQSDHRTLFLSGSDSTYVTPEGRALAKTLFPAARFAKIPGAGHWLHAEKPREFEAAVRVFLNG